MQKLTLEEQCLLEIERLIAEFRYKTVCLEICVKKHDPAWIGAVRHLIEQLADIGKKLDLAEVALRASRMSCGAAIPGPRI